MAKRTCSIDTCERPYYGLGWCRLHYQRAKRTGDPLTPSQREPAPIRVCSIEDCNDEAVARTWCRNHWQKWRNWGDPLGGPPSKPEHCSIEDCESKPIARGWCTKHYLRWLNHDDPLAVPDKSVPNRHEDKSETESVLIITRRDGTEVQCLYDTADREFVSAHQWYLTGGYACRNTEGGRDNTRVVALHRYLLGLTAGDGVVVDHISGDRLDCRRANLRKVDTGINGENRAVVNELGDSRFRGVCRDRARGAWKAYARIDGVMHNIGRYATELEAAAAVAAYREAHDVEAGYPRRHPETPSKSKRIGD